MQITTCVYIERLSSRQFNRETLEASVNRDLIFSEVHLPFMADAFKYAQIFLGLGWQYSTHLNSKNIYTGSNENSLE